MNINLQTYLANHCLVEPNKFALMNGTLKQIHQVALIQQIHQPIIKQQLSQNNITFYFAAVKLQAMSKAKPKLGLLY